MRVLIIFLCLILSFSTTTLTAGTSFDFGLSLKDGKLSSFHLAVAKYNNVSEKEVTIVKKRKVPDEEIPVVFLLAKRANVSSTTIIGLRLGGKSWMDITLQFGLNTDIYYVPIEKEVTGPPYGNAYGHYKNKKGKAHPHGMPPGQAKKLGRGKRAATVTLSDADVVNMVNLKFISEHYNCSPDEVIKMRSKGKKFTDINTEVKKKKEKKAKKEKKSKGKGQGKKWK